MPIYEYRCRVCDNRFELLRSFSDTSPVTCPKCGGEVKKLISHTSFILKGSGWYATDYASKNGGGSSQSSSASCERPSVESEQSKSPSCSTGCSSCGGCSSK
jgi:putative FmdB family regulatory protein